MEKNGAIVFGPSFLRDSWDAANRGDSYIRDRAASHDGIVDSTEIGFWCFFCCGFAAEREKWVLGGFFVRLSGSKFS